MIRDNLKHLPHKSGVYAILNLFNGKIYIGQSQDIRTRNSQRLRKLERGIYPNKHLQSAWNKYGANAFVFGVLELTDRPLEREDFWIEKTKAFHSGYNQKKGLVGKIIYTDSVRSVISKKAKERKPISEETRKRMSESARAQRKPLSDETKRKISEARKGQKLTEETLKKLRGQKRPRSR